MATLQAPRPSAAIAWAGAAVFAAAQLWFVYSYAAGFDTRLPHFGALGAVALDVALFSLFALHHSVLARAGPRRLVRRFVPAELERSTYTWVASLLFFAVCTLWEAVPGAAYRLAGIPRLLAYAVQATGVVLTIKASSRLDVLDLAGVRHVQHARAGTTPSHVGLETGGLYGFVRHPLYFAWLLVVFGAPDMTATRLTFAIVSSAYLAVAIPWEEQGLVHLFGAEYDAYRRRVRWRMMPWVY